MVLESGPNMVLERGHTMVLESTWYMKGQTWY